MLLTCGYAYNSDDKDKYLAYQCGDAKENPGFFLMTADVRVCPLLAG